MTRRMAAALCGLAALAAAEATTAQPAATVTVTGAAILRERIAPPPGTELRVTLHEAEARDPQDPGAVLAAAVVTVEGGRIPFALEVPRDALVFGSDYALALRLAGPMTHAAAPLRLRPDGAAEIDAGEAVLRGGTPPLAFAAPYRCADGLEARVGRVDGALVLEIGGARLAAAPERTGSGAKTAAAEDPGTYLWSKGDEAIVSLNGEERLACPRIAPAPPVPAAATLGGAEWGVEDLSGGGIIDASRLTLLFDAEGRLSGRGGCNAYSAAYAANGGPEAGALSVAPNAAMTLMACADAIQSQERRFLETLSRVRAYRIDATGALILTSGAGERILARR